MKRLLSPGAVLAGLTGLPFIRSAGTALAGLVLLWLALMAVGFIPAVRFTRERIEVAVWPRAIEVDGLYWYENPWPVPVEQGFNYPFPVDGSHPPPQTVTITEEDPISGAVTRGVPFFRLREIPRYCIRVPARGRARVRVRYVQAAVTGAASYILTTSKSWRRPLDRGEYVLVPRGVRIARSNYPLDGPERLSFARENFMPDEDWRFAWEIQ